MDVTDILENLNEAQRAAVSSPNSKNLILAGAGSGKTRVLVHRISWMVRVESISPYEILALTFTNKAAEEMRSRAEKLLGMPAGGMWVGTFHGIAHRLLRMHWQEAKLPQTFQILDADDQLRIVKRIIKSENIDDSRFKPKQVVWYINSKKEEGIRSSSVVVGSSYTEKVFLQIYIAYENLCKNTGMVDFSELLLRSLEILRDDEDLRQHYQRRFNTILVDEFQDTNSIQYAFLKLLITEHSNVFMVGDDDQSIYGWRGAKVENIQSFSNDFHGVATHRLEQNYRSTATILTAANSLISNNRDRLGKKLWTDGVDGELISSYMAFNEMDEAAYVVNKIKNIIDFGESKSEIAILYRSNVQSRLFEEKLLQSGIKYRVYGGFRFFERAEIKDALAYLRLIKNRNDDASYERVVNTPTRGIGGKSIDRVREIAKDFGLSLWDASEKIIKEKLLTPRAMASVENFLIIVEELSAGISEMGLDEIIDNTIKNSGLKSHYEKDRSEKGQSRVDNLNELVSAAQFFVSDANSDGNLDASEENGVEMDILSKFLSQAALDAGDQQADDYEDSIQLMTLHSAKGLEFNNVFLVGFEQGIFPSQKSINEDPRVEEERRLCYVGITRARKNLNISYAESRRLYGRVERHSPSQFLKEIPQDLIEDVRVKKTIVDPFMGNSSSFNNGSGFNNRSSFNIDNEVVNHFPGQEVFHNTFGEGIVLSVEGGGANAVVQVQFHDEGMKRLIAKQANLIC